MVGHGSPIRERRAPLRLVAAVATLVALACAPLRAKAEEIDVRLRFAWGSGAATTQKWFGSIAVDDGEVSDVQPLGVEPDEAAALRLVDRRIVVAPLTRRTFDGCDASIRADVSATVTIDLRSAPDAPPKVVQFPLAELAAKDRRAPLDEMGGYLLIQRAPGDRLRVRIEREHLVFQPEEQLRLLLEPRLSADQTAMPTTIELQLYPHRSADAVWQTTHQHDPRNPQPIPVELAVPKDEGAYRLHITAIHRPSGLATRLKPWEQPTALAARAVDFIVIDPNKRLARLTDKWETLATIDPASPSWLQRIPPWTHVDRLPGLRTPRSLGNVKPRVGPAPYDAMVELPSASDEPAWQAYVLPVHDVGAPHAVEIQIPRRLRQHLFFSVVEPDAAGRVQQFGRDCGTYGDDRMIAAAATEGDDVDVHRIAFWPRTKSPTLVVANRSSSRQALYGKIRLLQRSSAPAGADETPPPSRLTAAYVATPRFADTFAAAEEFDASTGLSVDDWHSFLAGANRFAQQLRAAGYNSAILSVAADGASLAPVEGLGSSPRFDSGPLASTGADPIRKDVLEALLRVFDREGLALIPAIELATPLPALEALRADSNAASTAAEIEWVGADGLAWRQRYPRETAVAPHYNLLSPQVQGELSAIVERLMVRYGDHPSFGGLAIQLNGAGYGAAPGLAWGMDDATAEHFAAEEGVELPATGADRFQRRAAILLGPQLPAWKRWRQRQTTEFYAKLAASVTSRRPEARLVLSTEELFAGVEIAERLRQAVAGQASLGDAIDELGLDVERLAATPGVSLLRPRRLNDKESVDAQAVELRINAAPEFDQFFAIRPHCGELLYHESSLLRLPSFDAQSPYGADQTRFALAAPSVPASDGTRRGLATALAARDLALLACGGELFPLAENDAYRDALRTVQELPPPSADARTQRRQPVTMRVYREPQSTTICFVNESPWPTQVAVPLEFEGTLVWRRLGIDPAVDDRAAAQDSTVGGTLSGGRQVWKTTLPPYGLQARRFSSPSLRVGDLEPRISEEARIALDRQIAAIERRLPNLDSERPYDQLQNPRFELVNDVGQMIGWQPRIGSVGAVDVVASAESAVGRSVRLRSEDALGVAVQSHLFPIPATGQLTVRALVRTKDLQPESKLYAWVEYQSSGATRLRYVTLDGEQPLGAEWTACEFAIDDLPLASNGQMRIQFHLTGQGQAWIDDVRLFDLRFTKDQRYQISKRLYAAKTALEEGQLMDCQRLVEGYWPRRFVEHVPPVALAAKPADDLPATPAADKSEEKGFSDRLRGIVPRMLR